MNIAYVLSEFVTEKEFGGLATYYDNVARLLADAGNFITIFVLSENDEDLEYYSRIIVKRVFVDTTMAEKSIPGSFMRLWSKEINRSVREYIANGNQIDLIQYANFMGLGFERLENVPTIIRVSSFRPLLRSADQEEFDINATCSSIKVSDFLEELSVIKADAVYSPSEIAAKYIMDETGCDISIIESPFYPRKISDGCLLPRYLKNKIYIITFGTLKALKGAKVIGDSIYEILKKNKDIFWVFAGVEVSWKHGEDEIKPSKYISEKAGEYVDRVMFLGRLDQDKLLHIVKEARICVMPSRVDNLPNTCIEAMALGKVVIATRGASFEQLIEDGKSGFLIERDDKNELINAVCNVLALESTELIKIGDFAKKRIERMAPERVRKQLIQLYQETINKERNNTYLTNPYYRFWADKHNILLSQCNDESVIDYYL